jgi:dTDP-4-amino-4,6-dideoxygalactose transaminase
MDPGLLEEELAACVQKGNLPKAVVPTDLYGQCADYGRIYEICRRYKVPVIVDAAEAMGAQYLTPSRKEARGWKIPTTNFPANLAAWPGVVFVHAGVGARAAVFSFNGNKIMTTSGGGMLASDDKELIEHARFLSQQARDPLPHYEHSEIGFNYRMSNVLAAIGRGQLAILDQRVQRRREIFDFYFKALGDLPGIAFMPEAAFCRCNRWLTVILVTPEAFGADREAIRLALENENIESRPLWKPMHLQPVFDVGDSQQGGAPKSDMRRGWSADMWRRPVRARIVSAVGNGPAGTRPGTGGIDCAPMRAVRLKTFVAFGAMSAGCSADGSVRLVLSHSHRRKRSRPPRPT